MIESESSIVNEVEEQRPRFPAGLLSRQEKDRLIERGLIGLYRWYIARSQANRNWNADKSFNWRTFRTDLSPGLNTMLEGYYAVEQYVPDYTVKTIQMTRKSYGRSHFQIHWGAEEAKHADVWLNTLLFSRHRSPQWIEDYQQSLRNDEWGMPWNDVFHTIFYVVIQERATQLNYLNTAIIARGQSDVPEFKADVDPILAQVAQTIAIDEAAHYSFFLEIARLYLYYYPAQALEALFDVINNFVMPGLDIIPNSAQLGEVLYRSGVYGPRQYAKDAVYFYHKGDTVEKLAREMTAGGFGSVPVVDTNGQVIGIVTEFDILKAIREGKKLSDSTAVEIMTSNPLTVGLKTTAPELIQRLQDNHLIRMPVVDDNGKLVGIVARRDILEGYVKATIQRHGFWP